MAIVLWNPTKDELEGVYAGLTIRFAPDGESGCKVKVDDAKGRHLLNELGPRGLTSLEYGDEGKTEAKKGEDGRKRSKEFKLKQIARYNPDNEARKARQLEYVDPPKIIKEWSKDLGVKLEAPYELPDIKNMEISSSGTHN